MKEKKSKVDFIKELEAEASYTTKEQKKDILRIIKNLKRELDTLQTAIEGNMDNLDFAIPTECISGDPMVGNDYPKLVMRCRQMNQTAKQFYTVKAAVELVEVPKNELPKGEIVEEISLLEFNGWKCPACQKSLVGSPKRKVYFDINNPDYWEYQINCSSCGILVRTIND